MNKDISVITIPATPPEKTSYGFLTLVLLAYMLGTKLNANKYLYLNVLHSYKDKQSAAQRLLTDMESLDIKMDNVLYDADYTTQFDRDLLLLKQQGYIEIKEIKKLRCPCGKVDCLNVPGLKYNFVKSVNDKKVCVFCNEPCNSIVEKSLVFKFPSIPENDRIKMVPKRLGNKAKEFYSKLENSEMLISKQRETGITREIDGHLFNIDIDFFLYNFLSNIKTSKRIIVGSSHVIYHMVMIDVIDYIKNQNNENVFVTMPYIHGQCQIPNALNIANYKKQIYMLGSVAKSSEAQFNQSLFQLVTKDRKENYLRAMYSVMMQQYDIIPNQSFLYNVNSMYMNDFNLNNIFNGVSAKLEQDKIQRQIAKKTTDEINIIQR